MESSTYVYVFRLALPTQESSYFPVYLEKITQKKFQEKRKKNKLSYFWVIVELFLIAIVFLIEAIFWKKKCHWVFVQLLEKK